MNVKTIHIEKPSKKTLDIARKLKAIKQKNKAELEKSYFPNKGV